MSIDDLIGSINLEDPDALSNFSINRDIGSIYKIDIKNEEEIFENLLKKYLESKNLNGSEIDYILYVQSDALDNKLNIIYNLQHKLNLINCQVMSVIQGCSGTLNAMNIASALIGSGSAKRVLILSRIFTENDIDRVIGPTILSDGLGLMEITESGGFFEIVDFMGKTNGGINENNFFLDGNPAKIVSIGTKLMKKVLAKNSMNINDIPIIVPLSTTKEIWELHCEMFGCSIDKVFLGNLYDGGHVGAVDTIRNLKTVIDKRLIKKGDNIILYGIGFGTSWGVFLLKYL
ncbi:MAG: 3-oxoacyl-(acyl-carrier-protein) synthase 3 [Firmicutes bacterium ADurb.Bin419]|nr:MAG: 3-oxoacyl-(acyl-carrier-protein) synthase 3 [Firmicutes bacterium ADurb.Bin419]